MNSLLLPKRRDCKVYFRLSPVRFRVSLLYTSLFVLIGDSASFLFFESADSGVVVTKLLKSGLSVLFNASWWPIILLGESGVRMSHLRVL